MNFYNTTNKILYTLESTGPDVWVRSLDGYVRTQAEFEAQQAANKAIYAGSGFVEWGKHYDDTNTFASVNDGMWQWPLAGHQDTLIMGNYVLPIGVSKTKHPVLNVNGSVLSINNLNISNEQNTIKFPTAPLATNLVTNGSFDSCLLYTSPSPRDRQKSRMPSSA